MNVFPCGAYSRCPLLSVFASLPSVVSIPVRPLDGVRDLFEQIWYVFSAHIHHMSSLLTESETIAVDDKLLIVGALRLWSRVLNLHILHQRRRRRGVPHETTITLCITQLSPVATAHTLALLTLQSPPITSNHSISFSNHLPSTLHPHSHTITAPSLHSTHTLTSQS